VIRLKIILIEANIMAKKSFPIVNDAALVPLKE
jgi:hypothetical protein